MNRHPENPIITRQMIKPSHPKAVVKGVLNPGAIRFKDEIILLLRVAEGAADVDGKISVPFYDFENRKPVLDVLRLDEKDPDVTLKDRRSVVHKGKEYCSTVSHLRLARSTDGVHFTIDETPFLTPSHPSEAFGVEDPRIVNIDGWIYITYTAVSEDGYGTSLIKTKDFTQIDRLGMIFTVPNKDVCIFPEKIAGTYMALHRPYNHDFGKSAIWLADSPDLLHWGNHRCLIRPESNLWESEKIGGGPPPIRTRKGWLEIYHGKTLKDGKDFYSLMALLLDLNDPSKVIYRGEQPVLKPELTYETEGFVPNIVFLNGLVQGNDEELLLYYSACDESICLARCNLNDLI